MTSSARPTSEISDKSVLAGDTTWDTFRPGISQKKKKQSWKALLAKLVGTGI